MEIGKTQVGSSSSLANELFGSKDSSSSIGVFGSIFAPSPKDAFGSDAGAKKQETQHDPLSGRAGKGEVQQPCHLSSSIYYGGQDIYSGPQNSQTSTSVTTACPNVNYDQYKKDGEEDDAHSASRGNWWQGSPTYMEVV